MKNIENMKKFYDTISEKYDFIFSLSDVQKNFFKKYVSGKKVLDVGAATGNLSKFLKNEKFEVTSIDINEKLIEQAGKKGIDVKNLDMLKIDELGKFDTIINIGNALPHLNDKKEIYEFLEKSYKQLNIGGKIIIQIINFIKFTKNKNENNFLGNLPLIENENVKFERAYYLNEENNIIFKTILDNEIENEEILLNISFDELKDYFEKVGFKNIKIYGGFDKSKFDINNSMPVVMTGEK